MFDWFKKRMEEPAKPRRGLHDLCYFIAFYMLPDLLFSDAERTIAYFHDPDFPAGPFLYVMACQSQNIEPTPEAVNRFQAHVGRLSDGREYFVLEYPTPPPQGKDLSKMRLYPYFSAILRGGPIGEMQYFLLGQRPFGGTTLRTAYPDGTNANLGPGPRPELNVFLKALESADPARQTVATHRFRER